MFEKFTDRARKVMALANQEAQRFNHDHIGTEHILLGLMKESTGAGAAILKNHGVDLRKVRLEVESRVTSGPEMVLADKLPQTEEAKMVVQLAIEEAQKAGHD